MAGTEQSACQPLVATFPRAEGCHGRQTWLSLGLNLLWFARLIIQHQITLKEDGWTAATYLARPLKTSGVKAREGGPGRSTEYYSHLSPGCPSPCMDMPGPQRQPMDLRLGPRPPMEPPQEPATLLALQPPQHLGHQLFLAGLQQQHETEPLRVKMQAPAPLPHPTACPLSCRPQPQLPHDVQVPAAASHVRQEQELRQLLHKDKSRRSKAGHWPWFPGSPPHLPVPSWLMPNPALQVLWLAVWSSRNWPR